MKINSILSLLVAALAVATFSVPSAGYAADFQFDLEGDGEGEFFTELTTTNEFKFDVGAQYSFNGGAGTEGNAWADGGFTGVGGVFDQDAGGWGNAYSNTDGVNFAEAGYYSSAFNANGGFAGDLGFGLSDIDYTGLVLAGGAGSATTGFTYSNSATWGLSGSFGYDVDADGEGSFEANP